MFMEEMSLVTSRAYIYFTGGNNLTFTQQFWRVRSRALKADEISMPPSFRLAAANTRNRIPEGILYSAFGVAACFVMYAKKTSFNIAAEKSVFFRGTGRLRHFG